MAQSWTKLSEIKDLIEQAAPKMASERQAVYLAWLGIPNVHQLTAEEASRLIDTRGGNRGYAPEGKIWSTERFILHPELFRDEYSKYLSGKVMRACIDYYHEQYFECSESLDRLIAMDVINYLQGIDSHWWSREGFGEVFIQTLKKRWPACCDGKSVFYYKKLPKILSQSVRTKVVNATGILSKEKIQAVMDSLTNLEPDWHENPDFKERFFDALRLRFPECCDGQSAEVRRVEVKREREEKETRLRRDFNSLIALANGNDSKAQYELAMVCKSMGMINDSFDWLRKSAVNGCHEAQLELAFFLVRNKRNTYRYSPPIGDVMAWLNVCYYSGRYENKEDVFAGKTKHVVHPVARDLLVEKARIRGLMSEDDNLKSALIFRELCGQLMIEYPG
jgi:hypothetical protein